MTDTTRIIDEIRAALEKVQHSEWFMSPWHVEEDASAVRNSNDFSFIANTSSDSFAAFIAIVNPLAIRALLDHVAALDAECQHSMKTIADERSRAEVAEARVRELEGLLREIMNAEGDCELMDAIDNTGRPYQSHFLNDVLTRARAVLTGEKQ